MCGRLEICQVVSKGVLLIRICKVDTTLASRGLREDRRGKESSSLTLEDGAIEETSHEPADEHDEVGSLGVEILVEVTEGGIFGPSCTCRCYLDGRHSSTTH